VRITKYVAQDNIQPIRSTRIVHRALDSYFSGYSRSLSRYVPCPKLQVGCVGTCSPAASSAGWHLQGCRTALLYWLCLSCHITTLPLLSNTTQFPAIHAPDPTPLHPPPRPQWEYPDDYPYEDTAPIGDDANLLAHDEPEDEEAGQEARLQRGRNDARSWASSLA
jgi:hypothetical protein